MPYLSVEMVYDGLREVLRETIYTAKLDISESMLDSIAPLLYENENIEFVFMSPSILFKDIRFDFVFNNGCLTIEHREYYSSLHRSRNELEETLRELALLICELVDAESTRNEFLTKLKGKRDNGN